MAKESLLTGDLMLAWISFQSVEQGGPVVAFTHIPLMYLRPWRPTFLVCNHVGKAVEEHVALAAMTSEEDADLPVGPVHLTFAAKEEGGMPCLQTFDEFVNTRQLGDAELDAEEEPVPLGDDPGEEGPPEYLPETSHETDSSSDSSSSSSSSSTEVKSSSSSTSSSSSSQSSSSPSAQRPASHASAASAHGLVVVRRCLVSEHSANPCVYSQEQSQQLSKSDTSLKAMTSTYHASYTQIAAARERAMLQQGGLHKSARTTCSLGLAGLIACNG